MALTRRHLLAGVAAGLAAPAFARANDALALLLAQVADQHVEPAPYLVSEKYDGVRALWDGRRLRFRSGRDVPAPSWFTERLPAAALDGELWLGRGRFDALSAIVRRHDAQDDEWRQVRYMVFELPDADGPFSRRADRVRQLAAQRADSAMHAVAQQRIADAGALKRLFDDVVQGGGEGLMLHRADALYCTGRSDVLLKLKPLADSEATVVAHVPGKGKYAGMLGALVVQTPQGGRFKLGSGFSDEQRRHPPAIGSTVTYAYRDLTPSGVPRFASFARVHEE